MEQSTPVESVDSVDLRNSQGAVVGASGPITQNFGPQTHVAGNAYFINVGPMPNLGEVLQASSQIAGGFVSLGRLLESAPATRQSLLGARASLQMAREQMGRMSEYKETHDLLQQLELGYRALAVTVYENGSLVSLQLINWRILRPFSNGLHTVIEKLCHYVETTSFADTCKDWAADLTRSGALVQQALADRNLDLLDEALQLDNDVISTQLTRMNAMLIGAVDGLQLGALAQSLARARDEIAAGPAVAGSGAGNGLKAELDGLSAGIDAMAKQWEQLQTLRLAHDRWQDLDDHLRMLAPQIGAQLGENLSRLKRQWERSLQPRLAALTSVDQPWATRLRASGDKLLACFAGAGTGDVEFVFDELRSGVITKFGEVDIDLRSVCAKLTEAGGPLDSVLEQLR